MQLNIFFSSKLFSKTRFFFSVSGSHRMIHFLLLTYYILFLFQTNLKPDTVVLYLIISTILIQTILLYVMISHRTPKHLTFSKRLLENSNFSEISGSHIWRVVGPCLQPLSLENTRFIQFARHVVSQTSRRLVLVFMFSERRLLVLILARIIIKRMLILFSLFFNYSLCKTIYAGLIMILETSNQIPILVTGDNFF